MASQAMFINHVNGEAGYKNLGLCQDKVAPFEATVKSMERKIEKIRGIIADLRGSSDMPPGFPEPIFKDHYVAPVYTVESPTLKTSPAHRCDVQSSQSLYSLAIQKALNGLFDMGMEKEKGETASEFIAGSSQQLETNKSIKSWEGSKDRNKELNFSLYDGSGDPHSHLKAYLDELATIGKHDDLKIKLFVRTLTGSALMWYAERNTNKWLSWENLAEDFIERFDNKLKRKYVVETLMHDRVGLVEQQSKDKGKAIILETSKSPKPKMRKSQVMTLLDELPSITFEMLRSNGILKPKYAGSYDPLNPLFNPKKHYAFHSGMPGHDTDECRQLRREIQNLIGNGRIVQKPRPQLIWYQPTEIIPTPNYTQLTTRPQTIWYPPPPIVPASNYIPASYPQPAFTTYPYGQKTIPRGKVKQKKPRGKCSISTGFITLNRDSAKSTPCNLKKRHD